MPQISTTTTITDDGPNPSTLGQTVDFFVNVINATGSVPDGEQVTLEDADNNNSVVGSGRLSGGSASIAVSNLSAGQHEIFAIYPGDAALTGSQSTDVAYQTVYQSPFFSSAAEATFPVGELDSFTITAGGYQPPILSENANDGLPIGVTFDPTTGILSGAPAPGTEGTYTLNFTADNGIGTDAQQTFILTVRAETPVITWPTPAAITYGMPLESSDFDATANVPGTFVYSQAPGDVLPAVDTPELTVTFTPDDTADYATVTQAIPIEVDPAPLTVVANQLTLAYGLSVPALTFTATGLVNGDTIASLPGSLATNATSTSPPGAYYITLGTLGIVNPEAPGNNSNYDITFEGAQLTITQATPVITWMPDPTDNETPLGPSQLNATADLPGTFVYFRPSATCFPKERKPSRHLHADGLDGLCDGGRHGYLAGFAGGCSRDNDPALESNDRCRCNCDIQCGGQWRPAAECPVDGK